MDRAAASTSIDGGQGSSGGGSMSHDSGMIGGGLGSAGGGGTGVEGVGGVTASASSIESVKGGEMLMDALDLVHNELAAMAERVANTTTKQHVRYAHSLTHSLTLLVYLSCLVY